MSKEKQIHYDNDIIAIIDESMGWIEEDGSCPSKTADEKGYDCKFIESWGAAWRCRKTGRWSRSVLNYKGLRTTLLAWTFKKLLAKNKQMKSEVDNTIDLAALQQKYRQQYLIDRATCPKCKKSIMKKIRRPTSNKKNYTVSYFCEDCKIED